MSLIQYLRDTKGEMSHIVWPTRRQAVAFTIVVIALSIITSIYLGIFDTIFTEVIKKFFVR